MTKQTEPSQPTADMDLSSLPDEVWVYDQARLVGIATESGTTDSIMQDFEGIRARLVIITTTGAKTGRTRQTPVVRVAHDGRYAVVASKGGAPGNPAWYHNLLVNPRVTVWDGTESRVYQAREAVGEERQEWWERAVLAWPSYAGYSAKTDRVIPVLVLEKTE